MPREVAGKETSSEGQKHMGKRTRQQNGYYAALHKGVASSKRTDRNTRCLPVTYSECQVEEKPETSNECIKSNIAGTFQSVPIQAELLQQSRTCNETSPVMSASLDRRLKNMDVTLLEQVEQTIQEVVAVVDDKAVALLSETDFLQNQVCPGNQGTVHIMQVGGQLVVRGSMEQVHQVLNTLTQLKNRTEAKHLTVIDQKECYEKNMEPDTYSGSCNIFEGGRKVEVGSNVLESKKVIYVESSKGKDIQVSVDVPSTLLSSKLDSRSCLATDCKNHQTDNRIISESVTKVDVVEKIFEEDGLSSQNQNETAIQTTANTPINLSADRCSSVSEITLQKSASALFINQPSDENSEKVHASTSQILDELCKGESTEGSIIVPVLASSESLPLVSLVHCGLCDEQFSNEILIKRHMEMIHASKEETYSCDVCNLAYPDKRTLLTHLKDEHQAANLTCQICGKKFECQRYLRTHLQRHAGVKKFECMHCGSRFFERHKLKFHLELHKAESERCLPYRCDLCGKQFANRAMWSDHCNTHSGHRPFECNECGARFGHRVGLHRHKWTHQREKPYSCTVCSRKFIVKPKLDEHMITHTGISKHSCPHCNKVFTVSFSLKRHISRCSAALSLMTSPAMNTVNSPPETRGHKDNSETWQSLPGFLCGSCNLIFTSYHEAEQHALLHESTSALSGYEKIVSADASALSEETCEANSSEIIVKGGAENLIAEIPNGQYLIVHFPDDHSQMQTENRVTSPEEKGGIKSGVECLEPSVEEQEQIHLAANTLADLSSM